VAAARASACDRAPGHTTTHSRPCATRVSSTANADVVAGDVSALASLTGVVVFVEAFVEVALESAKKIRVVVRSTRA
jgi:hypothetical protein